MKKDFDNQDLLAFLGRLTNKWGTGHESVTKILDKTRDFIESKNYKLPFINKVTELLEMLSEYSKGNFKLNEAAVGWIVASLAYLILPTDLIPDFLPGIGFTDDAAVFILAFRQLSQELEHFRNWKELESKTIEIEKE
ncbi:MAG: YkvA family protein [Halanaerobium sp.]